MQVLEVTLRNLAECCLKGRYARQSHQSWEEISAAESFRMDLATGLASRYLNIAVWSYFLVAGSSSPWLLDPMYYQTSNSTQQQRQ